MRPEIAVLTVGEAFHWRRTGRCTEEEFAEYAHAWQTGATRWGPRLCSCVECVRNLPADLGPDPKHGTAKRRHRKCLVCGERKPLDNGGRHGEEWCVDCSESEFRWKSRDFNTLRRMIETVGNESVREQRPKSVVAEAVDARGGSHNSSRCPTCGAPVEIRYVAKP